MNDHFKWIISGLFAAMLGLIGVLYANMQTQIADQTARISRANNRLNGVCERIALVEFQLTMKAGTCASE
ncbi:MAG: hypothetical protein ACREUY_01205 [Burkholderiales bacterium]